MIATVAFAGVNPSPSTLVFYGEDLKVVRNLLTSEWYVYDGDVCVFVARSSEIKYILVTHNDPRLEAEHADMD